MCTPKPLCQSCPIQSSCKAYSEGKLLATKAGLVSGSDRISSQTATDSSDIIDIEDLCTYCEPFELASEELEEGDEVEGSDKKQKSKVKAADSSSSTSKSKSKSEPKGKGNTSKPKGQQSLLTSFAFTRTPSTSKPAEASKQASQEPPSSSSSQAKETTIKNEKALEMIEAHVKRFPLKVPKKKAREEECVVCVIEKVSKGESSEGEASREGKRMKAEDGSSRSMEVKEEASSSRFLLEQRPETGLLASLWEHPTLTLPSENDSTSKSRKSASIEFVKTLVNRANFKNSVERNGKKNEDTASRFTIIHQGEVGTVPHVFSHIKLNMHVHRFKIVEDDEGSSQVEEDEKEDRSERNWKWVSSSDVDKESCGTGMRKAWELSKKAAKGAFVGKGESKGSGK